MKCLFILLIGLLSVSCLTVKRIEKNCDKFAAVCITETETNTETNTEITTEIEYRDTTIIVYISEDKVKDKIPVRIEDENSKPIPVKKEYVNSELSVLKVPFARSTAQVVNSRLIHELVQTDTLLFIKWKNAIKTIKIQEKQIKILREKSVVQVKENTPFAKACIKIVWGLVVIVVLGIGYIIFKYKSRIVRLSK